MDAKTYRIRHAPARDLNAQELQEAFRLGHLSKALLEAEKHRRFAQRPGRDFVFEWVTRS